MPRVDGRLLPFFSPISRRALGLYYRFGSVGVEIPRRGPLLLVANHPNSLLDPAAVCAVAGRQVRFLAKVPLFTQPVIGFLVRACGAIPVHRRQDDPELMGRNEDAFRAAFEALAAGDAVGVFPEGTSHSEPALAPLRTGAARIALGAAARLGAAFPIVPVGLVLRAKQRFRSEAMAAVGEPIEWDDLAGRGPEDAGAVRALTDRVEAALLGVTLNLERWEDGPAVECAEALYAAEFALPGEPAERLRRLSQVAGGLAALRRSDPQRVEPLYRAVTRYAALLRRLQLRPAELREGGPRPRTVARWAVRRSLFFGVGGPAAAAGLILFFVPYRLTGWVARRVPAERDVRSTVKLLGGAVIYAAWILLLAAAAGWWIAPWVGALTLAALPALGLLTLLVLERWEEAIADARSYFLLRGRADLRRRLLARRRQLAERLEALRREVVPGAAAGAAVGAPAGAPAGTMAAAAAGTATGGARPGQEEAP